MIGAFWNGAAGEMIGVWIFWMMYGAVYGYLYGLVQFGAIGAKRQGKRHRKK